MRPRGWTAYLAVKGFTHAKSTHGTHIGSISVFNVWFRADRGLTEVAFASGSANKVVVDLAGDVLGIVRGVPDRFLGSWTVWRANMKCSIQQAIHNAGRVVNDAPSVWGTVMSILGVGHDPQPAHFAAPRLFDGCFKIWIHQASLPFSMTIRLLARVHFRLVLFLCGRQWWWEESPFHPHLSCARAPLPWKRDACMFILLCGYPKSQAGARSWGSWECQVVRSSPRERQRPRLRGTGAEGWGHWHTWP